GHARVDPPPHAQHALGAANAKEQPELRAAIVVNFLWLRCTGSVNPSTVLAPAARFQYSSSDSRSMQLIQIDYSSQLSTDFTWHLHMELFCTVAFPARISAQWLG